VPSGWAYADGTLLNLASFPSLASVLGTTYGGNGTTTFALPDLRAVAPKSAGGTTPSVSYIICINGGIITPPPL
jgi:microcystin-dependent protein